MHVQPGVHLANSHHLGCALSRHITAAHTGLCLHLLHVLQRAAVRRNRHLEAQSLWKARVQLDTPLTLTLRHCWPSVTEQSEL
jgi:hypothetical protein